MLRGTAPLQPHQSSGYSVFHALRVYGEVIILHRWSHSACNLRRKVIKAIGADDDVGFVRDAPRGGPGSPVTTRAPGSPVEPRKLWEEDGMTDASTQEIHVERQRQESADLLRSVELMAKVGSCNNPSFSPDGKQIAFLSDLSGMPQVWIVPREGGWPLKVTAFDDPIKSVSWSPAGSLLAIAVAPGGGMNTQIYVVRPDGSDLRLLTQGGNDNNWLGPWAHDGQFLTFSSNRRRESMDCWLADPVTGELHLIAHNEGTGRVADVSRDQRFVVINRMLQRGNNDLFLVDLHTNEEACLTPHDGPAHFWGGEFSPDGKVIYLASSKDRDLVAFGRVAIGEDGRLGPIELLQAREDAELDGFELTEDGTTAALLWNNAGRSELALMDLGSRETRPISDLPGPIIFTGGFSRDGRFLALMIAGAALPWDVWVLEVGSHRLTHVTHSPHPGVDLDRLVQPELVRFCAHDELELTGWLYLPPDAPRPGPIVLSFHGGPEGQERPWFNDTYQGLVSQGIAVLAPNVRGSTGFGKRFVNLDNGALRVDAIRDITACVNYVASTGIADRERIGIMGGSYGGYMTMAGLTEYPDLFAAGANLFGIVNFETFFAQTQPWMAAISKVEYGDPQADVDLLRSLSPIHKIDRVRAPTIVLHGANDTNVPVIEAEQVVQSLTERGVPVEYILFPDEGHGFVKTSNHIQATVAIVHWFAEHLKARLSFSLGP